jgi:hypothetical protein
LAYTMIIQWQSQKLMFDPLPPKGGEENAWKLSKSPLGDLGVDLTMRAFETASFVIRK